MQLASYPRISEKNRTATAHAHIMIEVDLTFASFFLPCLPIIRTKKERSDVSYDLLSCHLPLWTNESHA